MNDKTEQEGNLVNLYLSKADAEERLRLFVEMTAAGAAPYELARWTVAEVQKAQQARRRRRIIRGRWGVGVFLIGVVLGLFLFVQPMKERTRASVAAWLASPTPAITITDTPTPTPTIGVTLTPSPTDTFTPIPPPTPPPPPPPLTWSFQGKIQRYGSEGGVTNARASLAVRLAGATDFQPTSFTDIDIDVASGEFTIPYTNTAAIEEAQLRVTLPTDSGELRFLAESPWVQDADDPTVFVADISGSGVPRLELEAVITRMFNGQVALSTAADGAEPAGVPGIQIAVDQRVNDGDWEGADCEETSDEPDIFALICYSGDEQAFFRLRPHLPPIYAAEIISDSMSTGWSVRAEGWVTNEAIPGGEFPELSLLYQLQSLTLPVTYPQLMLEPNIDLWEKNSYANEEGREYEAYTAFVTANNAASLRAVWTVFLPVGDYYLEVWTPSGMTTPVRYEVDMAEGTAGAPDDNGIYISNQKNRNGVWWDFVATGIQPAFPIFSIGEEVLVFAYPFTTNSGNFPYEGTTMAVGPIRIVVEPIPPPESNPAETSPGDGTNDGTDGGSN